MSKKRRPPLFKLLSAYLKRQFSLGDFAEWMDHQVDGTPTATGIRISNNRALNYSAVFNAVQIIAGTVASLPLILYKRLDQHNKERFQNHPLYNVLHNMANPEMTSFVWREVSQAHLLLWGNSFSQIIRNAALQVTELWPISPDRVKVTRNDKRQIIYEVKETPTKPRIFRADEILHIPGLGFDGRVGYSVITLAQEGMGLGLAQEQFNAHFYGQGTHLGNVLEHPGVLGDVAHDNLEKSLQKFSGVTNSHRTMILEEGMKWKPMTMPLADAQFLESRTFQIGEMARWFNLPPHKLKELSKATFSNIEQQQIEFIQDSMRPWLVRWEAHIWWKLLNDEEKKTLFAEFLIAGLLRADMASRNAALAIQRINGIINADEWRAIENMNPIEDEAAGQKYWMPLNMSDAGAEETEEPSTDQFNPEEDENALKPRELRSIRARRRWSQAFKPIFRQVAKEILAIEIPGIQKITKKSFGERILAEFKFDVDKFYKSNKPKFRKLFAAAYDDYAATIYPIAADEVNANLEPTPEYDDYVNEFIDHTTNRYVGSSQGQLNQVASEHRENDPAKAINERLVQWEERRPDKVADREVVDGESGFAQFVYFSAGFRTVWVTLGKNCPYCDSLNGRTVSRGVNFINAGSGIEGEAGKPLLVVTQNISHPAAHGGCDCTVRAGI